jgi:TP901 family phage tail tape measure protein
MKRVAERSRELGKDITLPGISAKDAALAMVELGKAGLSVNDTMAASKGVLSLAKAGHEG